MNTLRPDLPHRHARHVDLLLARGARHPSVPGREDDRRAAAADGGQHAGRQHGRFLRRRAVELPRDHGQDRLHGEHHAGPVEGPSREDARLHRGVHREVSEYRARHDCGGDRRRTLDRRVDQQQAEDLRGGRRQVLCERGQGRDHRAHARPLRQRHRQGMGRPELDEVLQRRLRHLPVPLRRHVVHEPAPPLGPAQGRPGLPRGGEEGEPHRHLQAGRGLTKTPVPKDSFRTAKLMDGVVWDGRDAKKYAGSFKIRVA